MPRPFPLSTGDRAPNCTGITAQGSVYSSEEQAGKAVVMILSQKLDATGFLPLLDAFSARAEEFTAKEADLVALTAENVNDVLEFSFGHPSLVTLVGGLGDFVERNGLNVKVHDVLRGSPKDFMATIGFTSDTPDLLILDSNQRVAGRFSADDPANAVAEAMAIVNRLPREEPRDVYAPAPVLILPNLLDRELCRELIAMHHEGASESPSLVLNEQGHLQNQLNYGLKKRRDFLLEREHPMSVRLNDLIMRRVVPEIKRAFQADVSHTDRYNIACYPADGGHFRRHRDNRPDLVAFRRFALSINLTLDAGGYDGGYLRLPEFNGHRYRAGTGSGIIFSVALLHEITPVSRGDRYVLVTHLHDEEGEAKWMAMRQALAKTGT